MSRRAARHLDRALELLSFGAPLPKGKRKRTGAQSDPDESDSDGSYNSIDDSKQLCPPVYSSNNIPNYEDVKNKTLARTAEQSCQYGEGLCAVLASAHMNESSANKQHLHMRAYYELESILLRIAHRKGYSKGITVEQLPNSDCIELIKGDFLNSLFCVYSRIYFQNTLAQVCKASIQFDNDEPVTVGRCRYSQEPCGRCYDIKVLLSTKRFMALNANCRHVVAAGDLPCYNLLQCLMLVFEHELVHALISSNCVRWGSVSDSGKDHKTCDHIESVLTFARSMVKPGTMTWKDLRQGHVNHKDGHSRIFTTILHNLFGHKTIYEDLQTGMLRKRPIDMSEATLAARRALTPGETVNVFRESGEWTVIGHYKKEQYISSQRLAYNNEGNSDNTTDGVLLQSKDNRKIMCPYQNIASFVSPSGSADKT